MDYRFGEITICLMGTEEFSTCPSVPHYPRHLLSRSMTHIQYCKAELLKGCAVGTFAIPSLIDSENKDMEFGYYLSQTQLIFIDDSGAADKLLRRLQKAQVLDTRNAAHVFFEFLEHLILNDISYMQSCEDKMADVEAQILENHVDTFPAWLAASRRKLQNLISYYKQLIDLSETLLENYNGLFDAEDCQLFHLFSDRAIRLADNAKSLWDYSLQLRELYQTQITIQQNNVMQLLTYVTTIVLPLTLLTGWYGMNFVNIPELQNPYGYFILIGICLIIVLIEIWIFKKKKWFK